MGYSKENKMVAAWRIRSIDACTNVVVKYCNLAFELNIPLNDRDNSSRKVNLTFKRGFIV